MSASNDCKALSGLSLADVVRRTGKGRRTLERWHKHNPRLFKIICLGAAQEQRQLGKSPSSPLH